MAATPRQASDSAVCDGGRGTRDRDENPLGKLELIANEIFERWDADQRSGKLLSALSGHLTHYRADVTEVRRALMHYPQLITVLKNTTHALDFCLENLDPGAAMFRQKIESNITVARGAYEAATGEKLLPVGIVFIDKRAPAPVAHGTETCADEVGKQRAAARRTSEF
jgi:hypothetical protein